MSPYGKTRSRFSSRWVDIFLSEEVSCNLLRFSAENVFLLIQSIGDGARFNLHWRILSKFSPPCTTVADRRRPGTGESRHVF